MTLEGWSEFNVAVAGAAAALAGLLVVAMSVNVATIVKSETLPARAASAIATLLLAVVATTIGLIPGQSLLAIGIELTIGLGVAWVLQVHAMMTIQRDQRHGGSRFFKSLVGTIPLIAFTIGAVMLLAAQPGGYYAVAAGCILAIVSAVVLSWVTLVEVLR